MLRVAMMVAAIVAVSLPGPAASAQCDPQQVFKLVPGDGIYQLGFGSAVATDGSAAIIGAPYDEDNGFWAGAAYFFDVATGTEGAKLLAGDGAEQDKFGFSVAIDGATAIVGAYDNHDNYTAPGAAYLFDVATGSQTFKLLPDDSTSYDYFGYSVAISGTTAVVGAPREMGAGTGSGSVYLFDTVTGAQTGKLLPDDGAYGDQFGASVAIDGTTVIVGSLYDNHAGVISGSAYLFDSTTGAQIAKLVPPDGSDYDNFGYSVAISGPVAVVGSWFDDDNGNTSGSAYLFNTATGGLIAKLLPADGAADDVFGCSVSINGTTAMVGAFGDDGRVGSAYLFDTIGGDQVAKIVPADGSPQDSFANAVSLSGNTALIGAYMDYDGAIQSGSAYLFDTDCQEPPTIGVTYTCVPDSGTVPFSTQMGVSLMNLCSGQARRVAARINVTLANGQFFSNWKAGTTSITAGGSYNAGWNATILENASMIGENTFLLVAEDVTPAPWNQPPHPPAGDTGQASCTVTGVAP